jgi:hypothetical protein
MGAKDWRTRLALSLTHSGRYHFIEYHHIFPKAALKGRYEKSEINEMANMAFVSGGANRRMGSTPAERTLAEVRDEQGDQVLVDHCVPLDPPSGELKTTARSWSIGALSLPRRSTSSLTERWIGRSALGSGSV